MEKNTELFAIIHYYNNSTYSFSVNKNMTKLEPYNSEWSPKPGDCGVVEFQPKYEIFVFPTHWWWKATDVKRRVNVGAELTRSSS